eukprot:gb/GFBE01019071.1/.p1 GENE.gb/GFBE01019071.1/~~gb/GFBE01019071.1/.p1  ORF type:complete len:639 (+),score=103.56 gb/GFBE01019071.1/:1-1917(+)
MSRFMYQTSVTAGAKCSEERLQKSPFFADCEQSFLMRLMNDLQVELFNTGDIIIEQGDVAEKLYCLMMGDVDVLVGPNRMKVATLKEGTVFGEMAMFSHLGEGFARRSATIRASGFCDCRVIDKTRFHALLKQFPKEKARFVKIALERKENLDKSKAANAGAEDSKVTEKRRTTMTKEQTAVAWQALKQKASLARRVSLPVSAAVRAKTNDSNGFQGSGGDGGEEAATAAEPAVESERKASDSLVSVVQAARMKFRRASAPGLVPGDAQDADGKDTGSKDPVAVAPGSSAKQDEAELGCESDLSSCESSDTDQDREDISPSIQHTTATLELPAAQSRLSSQGSEPSCSVSQSKEAVPRPSPTTCSALFSNEMGGDSVDEHPVARRSLRSADAVRKPTLKALEGALQQIRSQADNRSNASSRSASPAVEIQQGYRHSGGAGVREDSCDPGSPGLAPEGAVSWRERRPPGLVPPMSSTNMDGVMRLSAVQLQFLQRGWSFNTPSPVSAHSREGSFATEPLSPSPSVLPRAQSMHQAKRPGTTCNRLPGIQNHAPSVSMLNAELTEMSSRKPTLPQSNARGSAYDEMSPRIKASPSFPLQVPDQLPAPSGSLSFRGKRPQPPAAIRRDQRADTFRLRALQK